MSVDKNLLISVEQLVPELGPSPWRPNGPWILWATIFNVLSKAAHTNITLTTYNINPRALGHELDISYVNNCSFSATSSWSQHKRKKPVGSHQWPQVRCTLAKTCQNWRNFLWFLDWVWTSFWVKNAKMRQKSVQAVSLFQSGGPGPHSKCSKKK